MILATVPSRMRGKRQRSFIFFIISQAYRFDEKYDKSLFSRVEGLSAVILWRWCSELRQEEKLLQIALSRHDCYYNTRLVLKRRKTFRRVWLHMHLWRPNLTRRLMYISSGVDLVCLFNENYHLHLIYSCQPLYVPLLVRSNCGRAIASYI